MTRLLTAMTLLCFSVAANAAPSAPMLSVERIGTTLTISWSAVLGADSYRLYYAPAPYMGPETVGFIDLGMSNSVSANVLEGLAFYVAVSAIGGGEEGSYSNVEEFSITLASDKGKSCEQLGEVFVDGDNDGVCDAIDPAPTIKRIDLLGYESTPAYGNEQFVSSRSNTLINASIVESYSVLKHSGYIYPDSAGGDPVIYPGTYYTNDMHYCRVGNFNGDEYEDLLVNSRSFFNTTNAKEPYDITNPERLRRAHILLNDGNGSYSSARNLFQSEEYFRISSSGPAQAADLNNDGIDDILTQNGGNGIKREPDHGIGLFMSQPDGSFIDATSRIHLPTRNIQRDGYSEDVLQIITESFVALDVDGDGWKDLMFVSAHLGQGGERAPLILFNDKGQRFVEVKDWPPLIEQSNFRNDTAIIRHVEVVDFDLDGDEDVVALCYRECFYGNPEIGNGFVLVNDNGSFSDDELIYFPSGLKGGNTKNDHMDVADINGDSYPDIVTVSGESDPYYVDRDIQVLISVQGKSLTDQTDSRIANLRTADTGHAEGNIYLRDYDLDGDMDIIDFQDLVSNGVVSHSAGLGNSFPYGKNGLAIFLNDGNGHFSYIEENLMDNIEVAHGGEAGTAGLINRVLAGPYRACPIFFNRQFGYGFLYQHYWKARDPVSCPNGDCTVMNLSTVRKN